MVGLPTVLSDGETMVVCYGDDVYLCRDFFLKNTSISIDTPYFEEDILGNKSHQYSCGLCIATIDLSFTGHDFERIKKEDLKIGKDLFNNLTVNELLSLIKTKLKERK